MTATISIMPITYQQQSIYSFIIFSHNSPLISVCLHTLWIFLYCKIYVCYLEMLFVLWGLQTSHLSHHGQSKEACKICSCVFQLPLTGYESLGWPSYKIKKKKRRWGGRGLKHIYQFANQLKSVNSGTQAVRNVLLILHQCTPSCDVISFSTRFSLFAPLLLSLLHRGEQREKANSNSDRKLPTLPP